MGYLLPPSPSPPARHHRLCRSLLLALTIVQPRPGRQPFKGSSISGLRRLGILYEMRRRFVLHEAILRGVPVRALLPRFDRREDEEDGLEVWHATPRRAGRDSGLRREGQPLPVARPPQAERDQGLRAGRPDRGRRGQGLQGGVDGTRLVVGPGTGSRAGGRRTPRSSASTSTTRLTGRMSGRSRPAVSAASSGEGRSMRRLSRRTLASSRPRTTSTIASRPS